MQDSVAISRRSTKESARLPNVRLCPRALSSPTASALSLARIESLASSTNARRDCRTLRALETSVILVGLRAGRVVAGVKQSARKCLGSRNSLRKRLHDHSTGSLAARKPLNLQPLNWCGRGDLNPHAFRRHPLKMVCLPVPPLPHETKPSPAT
jgi:hypothetical protein